VQHFIWGVLLLPLVGFLIGTFGRRLPNRVLSVVGPGSVLLAFGCAVVCFLWLHGQSDAGKYWDESAWRWSVAGSFHLKFGLQLDPLSSTMSLIITGVGSLITNAWRTSRLARINSTKPSVAPHSPVNMLCRFNALSEPPVPPSVTFAPD